MPVEWGWWSMAMVCLYCTGPGIPKEDSSRWRLLEEVNELEDGLTSGAGARPGVAWTSSCCSARRTNSRRS